MRLDRVADGRRIAGAVRQEDAVRVEREDLGGARRRGHDRDLAARVDEAAQDVPLHAVVDGDDVMLAARGAARSARRMRHDAARLR